MLSRKGGLVIAWLIMATAALNAQDALPPLQEDEAVLLMPFLNRQRLGDSLLSYPLQGRVLIPLSELARMLGLAIRVDASQGRAEGYFIEQGRTFQLDVSSRQAVIEGKAIPFALGQVRKHEGDLYVDAALLATWFPLGVEADPKGAYLELKGNKGTRFPIEDVWQREKTYAQKGSSTSTGEDPLALGPHQPIPYAFLDVPSVDISAAWAVSGHGGNAPPSGVLAAAGDLFWMSAAASVTRDASGTLGNGRFDLFREDPDGGLLGPLKATRIELGDVIQKGGLDIVGGLPDGHGVAVSNTPLTYSSTFGQRVFTGLLPEGWTVELYQNGSLLAFQRSRPDGRYEFQQVPVRFGLNEFRLVFLGPHGERREQVSRVDIAGDRPKAGELFYQFTYIQPRPVDQRSVLPDETLPIPGMDKKPAWLGSLEYGLNQSLSMKAAGMQVALPQGITTYSFAGLRTSLPFLAMQVGGVSSRQPDGSHVTGWQTDVRTGYGYSSLGLKRSEFNPGFSLSGSQTMGKYLRSDSVADLSGSWGGKTTNFSLTGTLESQVYWDGSHQDRNRLQFSTSIDPINLMVFSGRILDSSGTSDSRETGLILSTNLLGFSAQGGVTSHTDPTTPSRTDWDLQAGFLGPWKLDYRFTFAQGLGGPDGRRIAATVTKLMGPGLGFGVETAWRKDIGISISLRLQVSLQREPRRGQWIADSQAMSGAGAVSAVAFVDANHNGVLDPGERILEGTRFNVQAGGTGENRSQDPSVNHYPLLGRGRWLPVELDTASLEDSSLQPLNPAIQILPRPGKVSQLNVPVAVLGEVNGSTRRRSKGKVRDLGGLELELVRIGTGIVKTLRTAFDGFFELRSLPLGEYELRVTEAEARRLKLDHPPLRKFILSIERPTWDGMDLIVDLTLDEDEAPTRPQPSP